MHLAVRLLVFVFFYILTLSNVFQKTHCLHLTSNDISIETHLNANTNQTDVQLKCHYDLDDDGLYSIHWYKDGREFYRFYPDRSPKSRAFPVNGANVDTSKSNETVVFLMSVDESSSGSYRFDAYGDPSFTHIFQEIDLNLSTTNI